MSEQLQQQQQQIESICATVYTGESLLMLHDEPVFCQEEPLCGEYNVRLSTQSTVGQLWLQVIIYLAASYYISSLSG
jgi:hypothetical protein